MKILFSKIFFTVVFVSVIFSCRKQEVSISFTPKGINTELDIHNLYFIDSDTIYAAAGKSDIGGKIFKSVDCGETWEEIYSSDSSVNDIYFKDNRIGFACGDGLLFVKTVDYGKSWKNVKYGWLPPEGYEVPLKHIEFVDDTAGYLTGGAFFDKGLVYRSRNGGLWWVPEHFDNELSTSFFVNGSEGIFGGYGFMTKTYDGGISFERVDVKGDFYTSFSFIDGMNGFACGYNGGIYQTTDGGNNWKTVFKPNGFRPVRIHFNDICVDASGKGFCAGNSGVIYYSGDSGSSWEKVSQITSNTFFSVTLSPDGDFWITAGNGEIFVFPKI